MTCTARSVINTQRLGNALRFWDESTRGAKNLCDAVVAHFFRCPTDRYRAHSTPKPGHIAKSPCSGYFVLKCFKVK